MGGSFTKIFFCSSKLLLLSWCVFYYLELCYQNPKLPMRCITLFICFLFCGSYNDVAASKRILEKSNLSGYQVLLAFIVFLKIALEQLLSFHLFLK